MIIAIDGPAGSGKSSTARAVARVLGFSHLDSGAFYRAITYAAMQRSIPVADWARLGSQELTSFSISAEPDGDTFRMLLDDRDISMPIRGPDVTANVSAMARIPAVREWLLDTLRDTARDADLVADGRDIGTVVFPEADIKIFLVADPAIRAERRLLQMKLPADPESVAAEVRRIEERDRLDSERSVAPLRQAADAVRLDTTKLSFEQQVAEIVSLSREQHRKG